MSFLLAGFLVAYFFAFNVGASGAAATMGTVYGAGVIKRKRIALILSGTGCLLGALWGGEVVETIGKGLIPEGALTIQVATIILAVSAFTLYFTNMIGIPLSTSEVTIGSIVGVGLSLQQIYLFNLLEIVLFWVLVPIISFLIVFIFVSLFNRLRKWFSFPASNKVTKCLCFLLILTGFLEAFAAGMNNVANAVGPLVGAGVLDKELGLLTGGIFIALGSIFLGGRVLETNGKKISHLTLSDGIMVSGTSGLLVIGASVFGIPIPMTQVTTSGIVGVGAAKDWKGIWRNQTIYQILKVWVTSPIISLVLAFSLTEIFLNSSFYNVAIISGGILATLIITNFGRGAMLKKPFKEEMNYDSQ
ncbi:inorganic phosphate transporter [Halobacillus sp. Marseille-Q1614]|uniref:inorganic phosphate transporter n=1 Tax=Halobacillus sp. Marseille-Q1614 TaxID=2709134 RepID=UPI00156E388E|nr:inorganic phosphate transporter [Halobacillus sp. Marseille-Q1614]